MKKIYKTSLKSLAKCIRMYVSSLIEFEAAVILTILGHLKVASRPFENPIEKCGPKHLLVVEFKSPRTKLHILKVISVEQPKISGLRSRRA